ncbi:hypothetical protein [Flavobacterium sp. UBA4197]|uniref:hypothetical protein n=1 Tax=Flavobacterium sp. UBA4197 TaxID=1946546 RepID=UPI002579ED02|nr:hypothetical protein [Flavobacterium sp. UBA4197]
MKVRLSVCIPPVSFCSCNQDQDMNTCPLPTKTYKRTFSSSGNLMVLTDVGAATSHTDGGIILSNNFPDAFTATPNMGTIAMSNQIRIYEPGKMPGNPVAIASENITKKIFIAERLGRRKCSFI